MDWTIAALSVLLPLLTVFIWFARLTPRVFGLSTDVNSGDVDDSFAISYVVTRGFFVRGRLYYTLALLRWFAPLLQPCTIRIALESRGDLKLLVGQLSSQMYGTVTRVETGFLTSNFELIELYQSGYKVVFTDKNTTKYELVSVGADLEVNLLEIAGPTSCLFNTTGQLLYVGHMSLCGQSVEGLTGANAGELSRECVEKAVRNGAKVSELPVQFSRSILCCLPPSSPLLGRAAQLQLNPWAFSFPQEGHNARQFAESNRDIGACLLAKMGLTYEYVWSRLDGGVRAEVAELARKFSHWGKDIACDRILWAVVNSGGRFPWRSHHQTSVSPPFTDLWSLLDTERVNPLELFEYRVRNVSSFTGLAEDEVRGALSHAILYDLYGVVLLKYGMVAERVADSKRSMQWFKNHLQTFVNSIPPCL